MTDAVVAIERIQQPASISTQAEEAAGITHDVEGGVLVIENQKDLEFAAEVLAQIKGRIKALEGERKKVTAPLNEALKVVRAWFKDPIDEYRRAENVVKEMIGGYHYRQAELQRQALAAAQAASMQGQADPAAQSMQVAVAAEVQKVDGLQMRQKVVFDVVNFEEIPRQFLLVNKTAVMEYYREYGDQAQIPGIRFRRETTVASRSA